MMTNPTISEHYRREQQQLHDNPRYGVASLGYAPLVQALLKIGGCRSLSDYGAGKCRLASALGDVPALDYRPYDPAFPDYGPPRPADFVACIDVLEHIEPDSLDACLAELGKITTRLALLTVHTGPAKKHLSDGRNAHLTQQPVSWWMPRLARTFDILHVQTVRKGFFAIVCAKGAREAIAHAVDLRALARAARRCDPRPDLITRCARGAKREAGALWLAARDPRTPWYVKLLAGAATALALSPVDLTPDVVPLIGHVDDVLLLLFATLAAVMLIPRRLFMELQARAGMLQYGAASGGAAAVLAIWIAAATTLAFRIWHPTL